MNDQQYVEEKIEDFFPSSSSDEANNVIKEILEKKWISTRRSNKIEKRIKNLVNKIM